MLQLRTSQDRGHVDHGWLKAKHTFSFASYYDPKHMHFRNLRVINQDIVAPGTGFSTHPHNDMEIITYIIRGAVKHKDSMGNEYVIKEKELQVMSAGTGVQHSEFNPLDDQELELLQIWILPDAKNHQPRYEQTNLSGKESLNDLKLSVSPNGDQGSLKIHQDVKIYSSNLEKDKTVEYQLADRRYAWVQLISGSLEVKDTSTGESKVMNAGDGLSISDSQQLEIKAEETSEFLLFDLN